MVMRCRSLGFLTDLSILERGGSRIERRKGYWKISSPHNPTFYWGNFLLIDGSPSTLTLAEWQDYFVREFPTAAHFALGIDDPEGGVAPLFIPEESHLEVLASVVLTTSTIDLVDRRTSDIENRPLVSDADWQSSLEIDLVTRDASYLEAPYREYLADKVLTRRALCESGAGAWWGTFVDGQLVSQAGIIDGGESVARYQTVGTHPEFRRRGFSSLTISAAGHYAANTFGSETLVIVADPDYHAIDLYQQLGFRNSETQLQIQRRPSNSRTQDE